MHNGDWFVDFVKVGDAVRVKAGSPVHPDKTGHPGWRSSPYQAAFGRKLVVREWDVDSNGKCVRVKYDGEVEGMEEFVVFEEVGSRRVEKPALKAGDWVKIVGPSFSGYTDRIGEVVKLVDQGTDSAKSWFVSPSSNFGNIFPPSSLEPASPPEKSKAEKMVEAIKDHDVTGFSVDGDVIASIDHLEASATGNIVTVKYHLKP